jgi:hypothetical protein
MVPARLTKAERKRNAGREGGDEEESLRSEEETES